jgi:hypothetical protein
LIVLFLTLGIATSLSCSFTTQEFLTFATDCESATEPTQQDVDYILAFTRDAFKSSGWERSYTVEPYRVSVTWLNNQEGALAFLEYLIYSCGYTQTDIEEYYSDQNFEEVIFYDYQNLQRTAICTNTEGDITLYEFTAELSETEYLMRYWIKLDSPTRVLDLLIAFPRASQGQLHTYAEAVFPELSVCEEQQTD